MSMLPLQLLRVLLSILAVVFAAALGRVVVRLRREKQPYSKALTWVLRTMVCLLAVFWRRGFDTVSIVALVLVVVAFVVGMLFEQRPRHEDETHLFEE